MMGNGFLPQTLFLTLKQEDSCVFMCVGEREREGDREREIEREKRGGGGKRERRWIIRRRKATWSPLHEPAGRKSALPLTLNSLPTWSSKCTAKCLHAEQFLPGRLTGGAPGPAPTQSRLSVARPRPFPEQPRQCLCRQTQPT